KGPHCTFCCTLPTGPPIRDVCCRLHRWTRSARFGLPTRDGRGNRGSFLRRSASRRGRAFVSSSCFPPSFRRSVAVVREHSLPQGGVLRFVLICVELARRAGNPCRSACT